MRRQKLMIGLVVTSCMAGWLANSWSQENADRSGFALPTDPRNAADLRDSGNRLSVDRGIVDQRSYQAPISLQSVSRRDEYARQTGLQPVLYGGTASRESQSIAEQVRGLPPNHPDREAKLTELSELLKVEFDSIQEARENELAKLENQIKKMREDHESRQQNTDVIIQRRIDQLVGRPDQWGWTPPPLPFSIAHPIMVPTRQNSDSFRSNSTSFGPIDLPSQPSVQSTDRDSRQLRSSIEGSRGFQPPTTERVPNANSLNRPSLNSQDGN